MRPALRSSLVAAALAGTVLAPVAGSASASGAGAGQGAQARPQAPVEVPAADDSRYLGQAVYLGEGQLAVLRNTSEHGPEVWIRTVGRNWKPGRTYMVRVAGLLDSARTKERIGGLDLELTRADSDRPVLTVAKAGAATRSHSLPVRDSDVGRGCVSQTTRLDLGAGVYADLTTSPRGPKAVLREWGGEKAFATLSRARTSLPASAGITVRVLDAATAAPVLEWKTQGGPAGPGHHPFPPLPTGCAPTA
ncbi:hypothetical protein [Streptomyces sp. NPDC012888]|uniref:hypothetical protein n=1 Tax=Streptomyces sp. NPDC012888 TaxID=3364855 RepID=UPI0036B2FA0C